MTTRVAKASCLCGAVGWEVDLPITMARDGESTDTSSAMSKLAMSHCHCSRCRKAHGASYGTYVVTSATRFRLTRGQDHIVAFESSPGMTRPFCKRCGSVVPDGVAWNGRVGVPAGNFDDDIELRPTAHLFVSSKAPWDPIRDDLPKFDGYPEELEIPAQPDRDLGPRENGKTRGSCLCGAAKYVIDGQILRSRTCHCSRCRKAGSSANVAYLATVLDGLHYVSGEESLTKYKVPDARFFQHWFCTTCGSSLPRKDHERGMVIVPMGTLDDDPGVRPSMHIFVGSRAAWDEIADDLPTFDEAPPA